MTEADSTVDATADRPGILRRTGSLLPAGHWFYLLVLLVPMALVDVVAQSVRITGNVSGLDTAFLSSAYFSQIRSTVFYYFAVIVFWVGAFSIVRRTASRRLLTVAFHLCFVVQSIFIILTQLYYILLDVTLNSDSFQLVKLIFQVEMFKIIQAELQSFIPVIGLSS